MHAFALPHSGPVQAAAVADAAAKAEAEAVDAESFQLGQHLRLAGPDGRDGRETVQSGNRVRRDAEADASPGRVAAPRDHASQDLLGVAAGSSPAQFCLICQCRKGKVFR